MKIALVSLSYLPITEKSMGGLEAFVYGLSKKLAEKNEVTLFGLKESRIGGSVVGITNLDELNSENLPLDNKYFIRRYITYQQLAFNEALKGNFDCIHVNLAEWQIGFLLNFDKNVVVTAHGNYLDPVLTKRILEDYPNAKLVTTSKYSQENFFPEYQMKFQIYNGLDLNALMPNYDPDDYFVWLGRITPIKATELAIEVAKRTGIKLVIAGGIDYQDYFDRKIKPNLNEKIKYVGPVFGKEKNDLLASAKGLLFTSNYPESFGMVPAEAMACGTPVIAFNKGALPEVVSDNKTGFIVKDIDEMIEKTKVIDSISRADCRKWVEENFSIDKMVKEYLEVYKDDR